MVFHDHIEVISSGTSTTVLEFSTKEVSGGHAKEASISSRKTEEDAGIGRVHTFDEDFLRKPLKLIEFIKYLLP